MAASRRNRFTSKRSSWTHGRGQAGRCLRSLTGFEALEPRRLLATFSVPADITRIESTVHDGSEPIVKQGPGGLVLSAANLHTGGTVVEEGTLVVRDLGAFGSGGVQVRAGATLVLDGGIGTFVISSLVLDPGGRIDVGTSKLQVGAGLNHPDLLSAINTAKGDGTWNGTSGIGSSVVQKMGTEGTSRTLGWLGWAINDDSSFVVGFAAAGDTNLDGLVDVVDVNTILSQMSGDPDAPVTWNAGDFNHDDTIDVMDLADLFGVGLLDAGSYLPAPPPATPRNLQALPLSTTSITLSWATDDAPAGYEIERSADGITDWQPLAPETIQITGTSATISGFEPGERASFRVRAFAESPSWWWDDRYRSADTAAVAATAIPSAPGSVSARGVTPTQAEVNWTPGPGRSTGTVIQRRAAGDTAWVTAGTAAAGRSFFHDAGVEPGQTYSYRVQSVSDAAASAPTMSAGPVTMPTSEPSSDADHDGDGVPDVVELVIGSNTNAADTDGDGVGDYTETQQGSNPVQPGVHIPAEASRANAPLWSGRAFFDTAPSPENPLGNPIRDRRVLLLPAEIPLLAPILVSWDARSFTVNGTTFGNPDGWSRDTAVLSVATRWITVDYAFAAGLVILDYLAIDVDIDSDNNNHDGFPQRSEWEETLEEEEYGLGRLIMLDKPDRPLTPVLIQLPPGLPPPLGMPPDDDLFRIRLDWNPAGDAGTIKLWTSPLMDEVRRPESVANGGHQVFPGESYTLEEIGYGGGQILLYAEGIAENAALKTLTGVEREGKPEEYIRGTFIVKGQEVGSDKVKYLVANEDSFFYQLQTRQEVRTALASRGVYNTFADLKNFCLKPQSPADLGVDPLAAPDLGPNPRVPGLKAMIYQDYITGDRQYVLAFGGTDDNIWELEFNDWLNNIKQGLGWSAPQYTAAMKIGDAVGDAVGQSRLIVTGHSLGGGLASAAALVAGVRADTFNAAGLHEYTLYQRDNNDDPLPNPMGGYIELYPGTAARYLVAGNFITARYVDYEILNFVQGFIGMTAIGVQSEMDGPRDLNLALSVTFFAASVANRNPWGAAAAGLRFFGTMVELHSFPSILYGLLVTEGSLGGIQIDMLGYNDYF